MSQPPTPSSPLSDRQAIVGAVGVLAAANVARSVVVPSNWHLAFNLTTAAAVVGIGWLAGLRPADLGLRPDRLRAGARLGGATFAAISAAVVVGGALGIVTDDRADVDRATMLARVLLLIPVGTVLVEELIFRGVLHGLLVRTMSATRALVTGAVLFGLWHVFPAWRGGAVEAAADAGRVGTVAITFVATTFAGLAFGWLCTRSDSLVAPALAHLATNSVTFAVAWSFA